MRSQAASSLAIEFSYTIVDKWKVLDSLGEHLILYLIEDLVGLILPVHYEVTKFLYKASNVQKNRPWFIPGHKTIHSCCHIGASALSEESQSGFTAAGNKMLPDFMPCRLLDWWAQSGAWYVETYGRSFTKIIDETDVWARSDLCGDSTNVVVW